MTTKLEVDRFLSLGRGVGGGEVGIPIGNEVNGDADLARGGGVFGGIGSGVELLGRGSGREGAGYSGWVGENSAEVGEEGGRGGESGLAAYGTEVAMARLEEGDR
jgi:hypothetical protein